MNASPDHDGNNGNATKRCMQWLAVGTAMAAGAVVLAPYVLPLIGIGDEKTVVDIMTDLHANPASPGTGLAGLINKGMGAIPLVGETLAKGGVITALTSGAIGIGGVLLGRYMGKHDDGSHYIKWGKVISTAALITSAMVALPTVLTSITAGVAFIASLVDNQASGVALKAMRDTIGAANGESLTASGISTASLAVPHLLTCGTGALPALVSFGMNCRQPEQSAVSGKTNCVPMETIDRAAQLPPVNARFTLDKPTSAFEPVRGILTLTHCNNSQPVTLDELKTTHTQKLHLLIVDSGLKDFHHIHPEPTGEPGQYAFSFTPKTSNPYQGWTDITFDKSNNNYRVPADLPSLLRRNISARVALNTQAVDNESGLSFEWKNEEPLRKGQPSMVNVTVKDRAGNPVKDLQPVLGAFAHLAGFSDDGKTMVHCHPVGSEPGPGNDTSGPTLRFHIQPEVEGKTQFYLQVKYQGKDIVAPFGQNVLQPVQAQSQPQEAVRNWTDNSHAHHGRNQGLAY